jgi:O-antigen/teichoic acid export membrane protein
MISTNQKIIASNTFLQFIARVFSSGSTFIISIYLAKMLGLEEFGDFSKITTYIPFFYLLVNLGLNASFLRLHSEQKSVTWHHLFGLRLLIAFGMTVISLAILHLFPVGLTQGYTESVRQGIQIYSLSIILTAIITTSNALFQQHLVYKFSAISIVIGSILSLVGIVFFDAALFSALLMLLAGLLVSVVCSLFFVSKITIPVPHFQITSFKKLLVDTAPLSITLLFNLLYFRVDSIILTLSRTTAEVGAYNLSYKIFEFILVIPVFYMNSLYPILLRAKDNRTTFTSLLKKSRVILFLLGVLMTILVWICAPLLTTIHQEFSSAIQLLRILSLSFPLFFLSNLTMWTLIIKRKHKQLACIYGTAMLINIFLNMLFIPPYGAHASAVITIIGEFYVLLLSVYFLKK